MKRNPVGWFEIYVQDIKRAQAFYEAVLDVELQPLPMAELQMLTFPMEADAAGAAGALVKMEGVSSGGNSTLVYFSSDDCAVQQARIEGAGGKIFKPKFAVGEYGFIVLAFDVDGNMFGVHSMA